MDTNISDLTKEIAQYLEGWQAIEKDNDYNNGRDNGCLANGSGPEIHLRRVWNHKERVKVSGCYPHSADRRRYPTGEHQKVTPEITCGISRGAEAIAKDITKRFLLDYLGLWQWASERIAQHESDKANELTLMEQLGQACGIPAGRGIGGNTRIYGDCGSVWVEVKPYSIDYVEIHLRRVPPDLAEKICRLLKEV